MISSQRQLDVSSKSTSRVFSSPQAEGILGKETAIAPIEAVDHIFDETMVVLREKVFSALDLSWTSRCIVVVFTLSSLLLLVYNTGHWSTRTSDQPRGHRETTATSSAFVGQSEFLPTTVTYVVTPRSVTAAAPVRKKLDDVQQQASRSPHYVSSSWPIETTNSPRSDLHALTSSGERLLSPVALPTSDPLLVVRKKRFWAIGDSHTSEAVAYPFKKRRAEPSYARLVAQALGMDLDLSFHPGLTSLDIAHLLERSVNERIENATRTVVSPISNKSEQIEAKFIFYDFCLVLVGSNDLFRHVSVTLFVNAVAKIHRQCLRVATASFVSLVPPRRCGDEGAAEYERRAEMNLLLANFSRTVLRYPPVNASEVVSIREPMMWTDCVHYSSAGRVRYADAVAEQLKHRLLKF